MTTDAQIKKTRTPDGFVVTVKGEVNDQLRRDDLVSGLHGTVIFDLDGLTRVTSFGVREWVAAIDKLDVDFYAFIRCRPAVVAQFNMVARFGGIGEVVSLYLPYTCPDCEEEFEQLLDLRVDYEVARRGVPPAAHCPKCHSEAEFDDIPENYFSFVAGRPEPKLPRSALRMLATFEETQAEAPLAIAKSVDGLVTTLTLSGPLDARARFKRLAAGLEGYVLVDVAEMTDIKTAGLEKLCQQLMEATSEETYFIRCHDRFLEALSTVYTTVSEGVPRVATLITHGRCTTCETDNEVVDVTASEAVASETTRLGSVSKRCESCGGKLFDIQKLPHLRKELVGEPTPVVWAAIRKEHRIVEGPLSTPYDVRRQLERLTSKKYKLLSRIGAGGMAEVFLARQTGLQDFQKFVVIKRILATLSESSTFVELFLREARIAARLSHPNVVQIFDLGNDEGRYFIAMEYVEGWDLRGILAVARASNSWVPFDIACRIVSDVCAGLQAAHTSTDESGSPHPIVHRDVSPHNVLVSSAGAVKVTDFGIAKAVGSLSDTNPGMIKGKVPYMAPEQILNPDAVSPQTDVFAAGVILYQCLTFQTPFGRASDYETLKSIVENEVPSAGDLRPNLPPELDAILRRAMARSCEQRYASALEFRMALEALLIQFGSVTTSHQVAEWVQQVMGTTNPAGAVWGRSPLDDSGSASDAKEIEVHVDLQDDDTPITAVADSNKLR